MTVHAFGQREERGGSLVLAVALSVTASGGGQSLMLVTKQDVLLHICLQALLLWVQRPARGKKPAWGKRLPLFQLWTGFYRWHEPVPVTWLPSDSTGHGGLEIGNGYADTHRCG